MSEMHVVMFIILHNLVFIINYYEMRSKYKFSQPYGYISSHRHFKV